MNVKEAELIAYIKPILKLHGFRKKAKRWTKTTDRFTYIFFIQGSSYNKEDYYVRPGIVINDISAVPSLIYGHFHVEIPVTTKEEIITKSLEWFSRWADIDYLKKEVCQLVAWERRNPIGKRRSVGMKYDEDSMPDQCLFDLSEEAREQILKL